MPDLEGKVAIITGGADGIGRASVELFAEEGASVVISDIQDEKGRELERELSQRGLRCAYVHADVSDPADVKALIDEALSRFGRLDALFNNAGIEGQPAPTADTTLEEFDRIINVNLKGVFFGTKYAIPAMLKNGGGSIVNNASVAGLVGFQGVSAYCASKGGVVQLTRASALDYATQGIRVNCLCPGVIDTPMVKRAFEATPEMGERIGQMEPIGRMGRPREVAELALFLASERSSFITGAIIPVDGGLVAQ
jgi:NAD(P)-dependent dehydrogenase (short-subunit alcohol dehydrogenase family)